MGNSLLSQRLAKRRGSIRRIRGTLALSGESGVLNFDRRITGFEGARRTSSDYILPGFIDLQINGAFGIDVMSASPDDLLRLSRGLVEEGTTAWLPTVITSPLETIERCDAIIAEAMAAQRTIEHARDSGSDEPTGATILGMHLEGPFISPKRLGAHPPLNLPPHGEALERVLRLKALKLITLAPELDGAIDAVARLTANGVAVSLGHSDATFEQALAGVRAGARMFTHVFNAMRPIHHREPGIAGAALDYKCPARAAIIPDRVHLHPAIARLVYRARGSEGTILTTDRIAPGQTGAIFGNERAQVIVRDGAAWMADGTLTGSIVTIIDGVRMLFRDPIEWASLPMVTASNPASILALHDRGLVSAGARADLIVLDRDMNIKAVFVGGREID